MNKLLVILMLTILVSSCGKSSSGGATGTPTTSDAGCDTDSDYFNATWDRDSNGVRYDMSTCSAGVVCRVCVNGGGCADADDVDVTYINGGGITLDYFNGAGLITGKWQICDDNSLELFDLSDGSPTVTFTSI